MKKPRKLATSDSIVFARGFYGILNAQGDFWTPLAFPSEESAAQWRDAFWAGQPENLAKCQRTHKIVPVRVRLEQLASPTPTAVEKDLDRG